ncbi:IS630 family transposase [Eikenella sp. S3360]|uniref:IS630 family transposase n=1 Tax=Eikenella glucosivorans TaxID=2766967 RepID=A0ABS0NCX3_9NEIS|nr:IS630 family transposase [Eikenella glucosivorans]MBH5330099.1 IS630 family transposase [Eikenella glucosivorans]
MAYSADLRNKALTYYEQCKNISQTATTFKLSRNTLYLWIRLKQQTGSLKHQVTGRNAAKLDRQKLARYVGRYPDAYPHEIAKHFDCTAAAICHAPKQMGMTRKKRPTTYKEQDPAKVTHYLTRPAELSDYRRVYLDETGFDRYLFRPYARSPKGQLVKAKVSGRRYRRLSLVSAQVGNRRIAPMVYQHTMTGVFFEAWFRQCLLPGLTQKSVIILDNARFHRMGVLRETAGKSGHKVLPLAPYSPELNPIEKMWANIKRYLRTVLSDYARFDDALLSYFYFN